MLPTAPPRSFVPQQIDIADFSQVEVLYKELIDRAIASVTALEK